MAEFQLSSNALGPVEVEMLRKRLEELRGEFGREEEQDALHAGAARSAYEGLAGQPLPQQGVEAGIEQLFGDMGSIISRRPEISERSREDVKQRGAMLLQQRIQNIQILRDRYQEEANKIGKLDPIKSLEFAEKTERMNKVLEQLHARDMAEFGAKAAMDRTTVEQTGAGQRAQLAADTDIRVAEINSDARLLGALSRAGTGEDGKPMTAKDYDTLLGDLDNRFIVKGQPVNKKAYHMYKAALIGMTPPGGMTEQQWLRKVQTKLIGALNGKKLDAKTLTEVVQARALHFEVPPAAPLPAGTDPLNAPAVEAPGTPPDAALELIDEANELLNGDMKATGGMAAARKQQAQRRLNQIQAILKNRFGLRMGLPPAEVEGITVRP